MNIERIRPEDIIAKYSPEEICKGAEAYYASLADDPIHMQKPLQTVFEAADCFEGLGMLLRKLNNDMRKHLKSSSCFYLSKGQFILDSRVGLELEARIESEQSEIEVSNNGVAQISIKVSNTGKILWLGDSPNEIGKVFLGVHLLDRKGKPLLLDLARAPIGKDLGPSESRVLSLRIPCLEPGDYLLDFDMVSEKVNWFEMGQSALSEKARVRLRVK